MGNSEWRTGPQVTDMKVCLLFVCCATVVSHALDELGNGGIDPPPFCNGGPCGGNVPAVPGTIQETATEPAPGYRGLSLKVQDDDGKTLTFKTSSSEEVNTKSQEGGNSWCCKKHLSCCHKKQESGSSPTVNSEQGWCPTWKGCHMNWQWQCICPWGPYHPWDRDVGKDGPAEAAKPDSGLSAPTEEKLSVQKLVSAGLDLLKAGKKLKFNVDVKNPEALLGDKQSQEGGNWWCCKKHLPCCHKKQD